MHIAFKSKAGFVHIEALNGIQEAFAGLFHDAVKTVGYHFQLGLAIFVGAFVGLTLCLRGVALGEGYHAFADKGDGFIEVIFVYFAAVDALVLKSGHMALGFCHDGCKALVESGAVVGAEVAYGAGVAPEGGVGGGAAAVMLNEAVQQVMAHLGAHAFLGPEVGGFEDVIRILFGNGIGIVFTGAYVAAFYFTGQRAEVKLGIKSGGSVNCALSADDDVILVYTDGEILKNVLHDISALEYAGKGTVLLIEFRYQTVAGGADAGNSVAIASTHFLDSGCNGLQFKHK